MRKHTRHLSSASHLPIPQPLWLSQHHSNPGSRAWGGRWGEQDSEILNHVLGLAQEVHKAQRDRLCQDSRAGKVAGPRLTSYLLILVVWGALLRLPVLGTCQGTLLGCGKLCNNMESSAVRWIRAQRLLHSSMPPSQSLSLLTETWR